MVQKIHTLRVILDPNFAPYVERFQILKLLSTSSIDHSRALLELSHRLPYTVYS